MRYVILYGILIVIVVYVVWILYATFKARGKGNGGAEVYIQRDCRYATVKKAYIRNETTGKHRHQSVGVVEFRYDNGEERLLEFTLSQYYYYGFQEAQRKKLTLRDGVFFDYSNEGREGIEELPPFYMESLEEDRETDAIYIPESLFGPEESREPTAREEALELLFSNKAQMPAQCFTGETRAECHLPDCDPLYLIQICKLPPFLRLDQDIQELYQTTFLRATQKLLIHRKTGAVTGEKTEGLRKHGNSFQLTIGVREKKPGEDYQIQVELSINRVEARV